MSIDPIGASSAVLGLVGTFTACVQCFEYIKLGKQFGEAFEQADLKLDVARLSLLRWAEAVGLNQAETVTTTSRGDSSSGTPASSTVDLAITNPTQTVRSPLQLTPREIQLAERFLGKIATDFKNIQEISKDYEQEVMEDFNTPEQRAQALATFDPLEDLTTKLSELRMRTKATIAARQKKIKFVKKARWALYDKKRFEELVGHVCENTQRLIKKFPAATQEVQRVLALEEVDEIAGRDQQVISLLKESAQGVDEILAEASKQALAKLGGDRWEGIQVRGVNSVSHFGHNLKSAEEMRSSTWTNLEFDSGQRSYVHLGHNVSGGAPSILSHAPYGGFPQHSMDHPSTWTQITQNTIRAQMANRSPGVYIGDNTVQMLERAETVQERD